MAYKIKRKNVLCEELVIEAAGGRPELRLPVEMTIDQTLAQFNRLRRMLGELQAEAEKSPFDDAVISKLGIVIVAFFELIFGKDGCKNLVDYYENNYTEMLEDVAPFIVDVVIPQMNLAMEERVNKYRRFR